ncbi:hypothetical protein EW145_g6568 [Phellinidium pouzarii]|uniref:Uncharacterized protein n=1 Tax=Phellinidium pouzarii TaxID=167371 RepID=A0A4S4KY12_9AGAM|nr:hypothetical protein EW145_g6568 [Phellinidium pouzarii]
MYEDQQQQAEWHPDQHHPFGRQDRVDGLAYQPRGQGGPYQGGGQKGGNSQGGSGRDTMTEVQEQFSKIAETGKKTFSSLVTKVKAKMQEFDQSRNSSGSSSQSSWGSGTPSGAPPGSRSQAYYAPSGPPPPQGQSYAPAGAQRYNSGQQQQGYDAALQAQTVPTPAADAAASGFTVSDTVTTPPLSERIPPRPTSAGPPPAGNVDPTKIGMLPKRPVSLLGSTPPNAVRDDEDELDYVENPFEEQGK